MRELGSFNNCTSEESSVCVEACIAVSWRDCNIVTSELQTAVIEFGVNDRCGNGAGYFDIEEWADTTELTNVKVAGLGKCSYLVGGVHQI